MVTVLVSEPVIRSSHYKQDVCLSRAGEQLGVPFAFTLGVFLQLFRVSQNKLLAVTQQWQVSVLKKIIRNKFGIE